MNILLVYPRYPDTFWSFRHALRFTSKKAPFPPLGLLTVAAMLPSGWNKKLVDMNVKALSDKDLRWADYVFVSAMSIQRESAEAVIRQCQKVGAKVVAGGPLFTTSYEDFKGVTHFVLNEAEVTLPNFLADLQKGNAHHTYTTTEWPDIRHTPIPLWELVNMKHYSSVNVQFSRGCPFDCEFCDITFLNGRRPRTKDADQLLAEMDTLYNRGWRGGVFVVDDNFIGNKGKLKEEVLPRLIKWMYDRKHPFTFFTEASVNLADDEVLMRMMVEAGFDCVFVGIETPEDESLAECGKVQNRNRDLIASIRKMQNFGLQVQAGFIVGFDSDTPSIFDRQISFIQDSGIATAMVSILSAPKGTRLYQRLGKENRLLAQEITGDNATTNFIPKMNMETLVNGYRRIVNTIYSPRQYYERVRLFLREFKPQGKRSRRVRFYHIIGFIKSMWVLGVLEKERSYYWKLLLLSLIKYRQSLSQSLTLIVYGFHFRKVMESHDKKLRASLRQRVSNADSSNGPGDDATGASALGGTQRPRPINRLTPSRGKSKL